MPSALVAVIAEANGMSGDGSLAAGQVIVIPNKVTNIHNNSTTWRPYSAGEAIGRVDPTMFDFSRLTPGDLARSAFLQPGLDSTSWWKSHPNEDWASAPMHVQYEHYMEVSRGANGMGGPMSMAGLDMGSGGVFSLSGVQWTSGNIHDVHNKSPAGTQSSPAPAPVSPPPPPPSPYELSGTRRLGEPLRVKFGDSAAVTTSFFNSWGNGGTAGQSSFFASLALQLAGRASDVYVAGVNIEQLSWRDTGLSALGNAIGESLAAKSNPASAYDYRNGSDIESDNAMARSAGSSRVISGYDFGASQRYFDSVAGDAGVQLADASKDATQPRVLQLERNIRALKALQSSTSSAVRAANGCWQQHWHRRRPPDPRPP